MKKLFFGILVAMCAFAFSAFTPRTSISQTATYYYLGADGNYHRLIGNYNEGNCVNSTGYCAYKWHTSGNPGQDTLTPAVFNAYLSVGYFSPFGPANYRYLPD